MHLYTINTAASHADIARQQLEHGGSANNLRPRRVGRSDTLVLANLGCFVIALHTVAALMRYYFWKDNTLLRMMLRKRS